MLNAHFKHDSQPYKVYPLGLYVCILLREKKKHNYRTPRAVAFQRE